MEERPTTETTRTTHGGRMIWEQTRFAEDREGGTHVFHQQRYIPGIRSSAAGLRIPQNGFQMRGSSLGYHSDSDGHLFGIAGTRFEDVKVVIKPAILTARSALESAVTGARAQRGDVAGNIWYENRDVTWRNATVMGKSAADAMYNTIRTMTVLGDLGWQSYDGQGSRADILVDAPGFPDNARFNNNPGAPTEPVGVVIGRRTNPDDLPEMPKQMSAALDVVAHEWSHGVLLYSAELPTSGGSVGSELHEGFADFVGQFVEEEMQGSTNWAMGEDVGSPYRSSVVDNGSASFHRCDSESILGQPGSPPPPDDPDPTSEPHIVGHKLTVAFYLATVGGQNPGRGGCSYSSCVGAGEDVPADICDLANTVVPALGIDHSRGFFFELMTLYASPTTEWEDLPHLATLVGRLYFPPAKEYGGSVSIIPGGGFPQCVEYHDYEGAVSAHAALTAIGFKPNHELKEQCE